jgi:two-component system chemotaxis response regulator CheB
MSERTPLVTIGASAGGVEAVGLILSQLPESLPAAVLVVVHIAPVENKLATVLSRRSTLPVTQAIDGEVLETGRVYLAAPDHHLLVDDGHVRVVRGARENGHRPAIDPLFRSAAAARGGGVVAVVLTGSLDDGAAGSAAVSKLGGHVLVQDPDEAAHPSMPLNAIAVDNPDAILPLTRIPDAIAHLLSEVATTKAHPVERDKREAEYAALEDTVATDPSFAVVAPFACPSCGGALWEAPDNEFRFRCRIGHAFGAEGLLLEKSEQLDRALAEALRALEERAELSRRMAKRLHEQGLARRATRQKEIESESLRHALVIRNVLLNRNVDGGSAED